MGIKVVAGGVIEKDGKYLLVKEKKKYAKENGIFQQEQLMKESL